MRNKAIMCIALMLILTGCGKNGQPTVTGAEQEVTVEEEDSVSEEVTPYNLKPVEAKDNAEDPVEEQVIDKFPTQGVQRIITEPVENHESDNTSTDGDTPMSSVDANIGDIIRNIEMPTEYVMNIKFGIEGFPETGILFGKCGDYMLNGVESCFMWESDNGTFYKSADNNVMSVDVDGRSILFNGRDSRSSDYEDDDVSGVYINIGAGVGTDGISNEELKDALDNGEPYYSGTTKFNNVDCHVITLNITNEIGESQEVQIYIGIHDHMIYGMSANEEGLNVEVTINDYDDYVRDLELLSSGIIDDNEASTAVNEAIWGSVFGFMAGALSSSELVE